MLQPFVDSDPARELAGVADQAPAGQVPELELTGQVAGELADVLRGARDPLELLFPGGSLARIMTSGFKERFKSVRRPD